MCEASRRKVYRVKKNEKPTWIDKALVALLIILMLATPATAAYYAGIYHAISGTEVSRDRHGDIVLKLDGEVYHLILEDFEEVFN